MYGWYESQGIISVTVNGQVIQPFMYIDATKAPPWYVVPVLKKPLGPFESLEAAKASLIINIQHTGDHQS